MLCKKKVKLIRIAVPNSLNKALANLAVAFLHSHTPLLQTKPVEASHSHSLLHPSPQLKKKKRKANKLK
jgi:hypothetical protein